MLGQAFILRPSLRLLHRRYSDLVDSFTILCTKQFEDFIGRRAVNDVSLPGCITKVFGGSVVRKILGMLSFAQLGLSASASVAGLPLKAWNIALNASMSGPFWIQSS
jgi:hypothetical protein